ncbi:MAG TPA: DUF2934 domain-containing protein [Steroidobacteraceae bacterium]|nr:DUF2934 domain-containing protein [Steroidobacteraceae bacterium]
MNLQAIPVDSESIALQGEFMLRTVEVEKRPPSKEEAERRQRFAEPSPRPTRASEQTACPKPVISDAERYRQISLCAYYMSERRGFTPGHMWDDWLAAEREIATKCAPHGSRAQGDSNS